MPKSTPKPKRALANALEESTTPPTDLTPAQTIAKLIKAEGNHLYSVTFPTTFKLAAVSGPDSELSTTSDSTAAELPAGSASVQAQSTEAVEKAHDSHLVELLPALRSTVFLRRNGYVLVDTDRELLGGRENKIQGLIIGVVLGGKKIEREWRAMSYWPAEFRKGRAWDDGSSSEDDGPALPESSDED